MWEVEQIHFCIQIVIKRFSNTPKKLKHKTMSTYLLEKTFFDTRLSIFCYQPFNSSSQFRTTLGYSLTIHLVDTFLLSLDTHNTNKPWESSTAILSNYKYDGRSSYYMKCEAKDLVDYIKRKKLRQTLSSYMLCTDEETLTKIRIESNFQMVCISLL